MSQTVRTSKILPPAYQTTWCYRTQMTIISCYMCYCMPTFRFTFLNEIFHSTSDSALHFKKMDRDDSGTFCRYIMPNSKCEKSYDIKQHNMWTLTGLPTAPQFLEHLASFWNLPQCMNWRVLSLVCILYPVDWLVMVVWCLEATWVIGNKPHKSVLASWVRTSHNLQDTTWLPLWSESHTTVPYLTSSNWQWAFSSSAVWCPARYVVPEVLHALYPIVTTTIIQLKL
jgi:hypothetical protein